MTEISSIEEIPKIRNFGGKLTGFESREDENHEKKHLKAYLKGAKMFRNGFYRDFNNQLQPRWFDVIEIWK